MLPRTLSTDLALGPSTSSFSRRLVRMTCEQWGVRDDDAVEALVLVVSELVTNAARHCGAQDGAALELSWGEAGLRIAVVDCSPVVPRPRLAHETDEGGRGLHLVAHLSSTWGVEPYLGGKRVFAVVPVGQAVCA